MSRVEIWTDGACSGNPGPGGWGAILKYGDKLKELKGGEAYTTNNRMELMAAISALEALTRDCERSVREGRLTVSESQALKRFYENELNGYAYLEP